MMMRYSQNHFKLMVCLYLELRDGLPLLGFAGSKRFVVKYDLDCLRMYAVCIFQESLGVVTGSSE